MDKILKERLREKLPIWIARKKINAYLGGIVTPAALACADQRGTGPRGMFRLGRTVVYQTDKLLDWLEQKGKI